MMLAWRPFSMTTPPRVPGHKWTCPVGAMLIGAFLTSACAPSSISPTRAADAAGAASAFAGEDSASEVANTSGQNGAALTPSLLLERGWACRQPPIPNRVICSRPNQGFPVAGNPPPADRPATFTFLAFDGAGTFIGTQLMIRSDLYQGQRCGPAEEPFILRAPIGYYECVHAGA
jgi:hypothetical protein